MFTRIVECRVKPDKRDEFNNKLPHQGGAPSQAEPRGMLV